MKFKKQKPIPLVLIAAAASAFAGSVQAQALEIYGRIDLSLAKESGQPLGGTALRVADGSGSRIGFRASEDLGGGWKAGVNLEHQFDASTGQQFTSAKFWDRRSVVELASSNWGALTMGREYSPVFVLGVLADPFTWDNAACYCGGGIALASDRATGNPYVALGTVANIGAVRYDNAVTYTFPTFANTTVKVQRTFAEGVPGLGASYAIAATYGSHFGAPLALSVGYEKNRSAPGPAGAGDYWIVAGGYRFDTYRLTAAYSSGKSESRNERTRNVLLGAEAEVGAGTFKVSYDRFRADQAASWATSKWVAGYFHSLSKRTYLYASVSRTRASGLGTGATVNGSEVGVAHNF